MWSVLKNAVASLSKRCSIMSGAIFEVSKYISFLDVRPLMHLSPIAVDGVVLLPMDPFLESLTPKKEELFEVLNRFSAKITALSR